ncbi:hypothetical protein Q8G50_34615, partial [Klebsiella pneumoniae]
RMLVLWNLSDPPPPGMIPNISLDELDRRGDFEVVHLLFNLDKFKPEKAEIEAKKLLGPQGTVIPLLETRQVYVTDSV